MQIFNIPDNVITGVAAEIHSKTNKDYKISVVGVPENLETPQVFEIKQFDKIDAQSFRIYAIDGTATAIRSTMAFRCASFKLATFAFIRGNKLASIQTMIPLSSDRSFTEIRCSFSAKKTLVTSMTNSWPYRSLLLLFRFVMTLPTKFFLTRRTS